MGRAGFFIDTKPMAAKVIALPGVIDRGVRAVMEYHAPQVSSYAKTNAPWEDQTGNARNGLDAKAYSDGSTHGIVLFHQVPYGIWLEVRFDGQNATIMPTILNQGPEVMKSLNGLLGRL
jgi:hypothetical protein